MGNFTGMAGYTKLFNSILASTIWREDNETRIVWITLLAMADKNGIAEGSVPGVADFARVSVPNCRKAIQKLSSPDEDSRSKEHDGRRIEACDGGWRILNHAKYRAKMGLDERREYNRVKQQEHRQKVSTGVIDNQHCQHIAEADTEADTKPKKIKPSRATRSTDVDFEAFWSAYPKKVAKSAAIKAWAKQSPPIAEVLRALLWQVRQSDWMKSDGQYIPHPTSWLNSRRWEDESVKVATPEPSEPSEDWFEECKRVHDGKCELDRMRHHLRIQGALK